MVQHKATAACLPWEHLHRQCFALELTGSPLQALKAGAEEYGRILELLGRYAIFKEGVAFSCKKQVQPVAP